MGELFPDKINDDLKKMTLLDINDKLKELECPFTWNLDSIIIKIETLKCEEDEQNNDESIFPIMEFMKNIMFLFINVNNDLNRQTILKDLQKSEEKLFDLQKNAEPGISIAVAEYVLQATKGFAYHYLKMGEELKKTLDLVQDIKFTTKEDKSTLLACKSICWYRFSDGCYDNTVEKWIREVIQENPNYHLWYYLLSKILRRKRRFSVMKSFPNPEEIDMFYKAYDLSKNVLYKMHIAQVHRENRNKTKALQLYEEIYNEKPKRKSILLRLALGFIHMGYLDKAKNCLDQVGQKHPNNGWYAHYCAIYFMKTKQNESAKTYFEKAIACYNMCAEKQYIDFMYKLNNKLDVSSLLTNMLEKYKDSSEHRLQPIILDTAFTFWKNVNDVNKALNYFYKAIIINPKAACLLDYSNNMLYLKNENVYKMLDKDFIPRVNYRRKRFSPEEIEKVDILQEYCDKNISA